MKLISKSFILILILSGCSKDNGTEDSSLGKMEYQNQKYELDQGYNVWFSELDCGNYDVFAYGLYLTQGIEVYKYDFDDGGKALVTEGEGNICCFNLFCKSADLLTGTYTFVDDVQCSEYVLGEDVFTVGPNDKLASWKRAMNNPTHCAFDVDLTIDWDNYFQGNDPTDEDLAKYNDYQQKLFRVKSGELTIEKNGVNYEININCTTEEGQAITGTYMGPLTEIEFGI
ncbi:MAG: hypothetical protein PHI28_18800 [Mangrovibacterium sp.]|nr:hypothetical protein [Mangrovibacterium sp.]